MTIERVSSGIAGLDEILEGGLPKKHAYLLQGDAGTGKTTLAFQFLLAGVQRGEKVLYISILQSAEDIEEMALSHGWDLTGINLEILIDEAVSDSRLNEQNLLPSSEVQLNEVMTAVKKTVKRVQPDMVVFDSIEQFRLIAGEPLIYQQKAMALLRIFDQIKTTSIFIHTNEEQAGFKTLAHGIISLQADLPMLGGLRRFINVEKMRSISFKEGRYFYRICRGGLVVYPPLPMDGGDAEPYVHELVDSGNDQLNTLVGGGLQAGTACLLAGAAGTGKSSIANTYAYASAREGRRAVLFVFDEHVRTVKERSRAMGMDLDPLIDKGLINLVQVNVADFTAGELAHMMRREVEEQDTRLVVVDSVSGYYNAMPGEPKLTARLHEMLSYLGQKKVLTLLVMTEHGLFSEERNEIDVSYISDSIIMLRRFEARGKIRFAISAIKKRIGDHEKTIRELKISEKGIEIGQPLCQFEGILTGHPRYVGNVENLIE